MSAFSATPHLSLLCLHSALLGFLLLLATVKLKSGFSLEHFGVWIFLSKVIVYHIYILMFVFQNVCLIVFYGGINSITIHTITRLSELFPFR